MMRFAAAMPKQPIAIFVMLEGSVPRALCRAQNATMNGVKAKIMNGLNDWNHSAGISPRQNPKLKARLV